MSELTTAGWTFDPWFTFHDELWTPGYGEVQSQTAQRVLAQLNEIWATDDSTFISITAHSGVIYAFFQAVGHHDFSVGTGVFVPVLVSRLTRGECDGRRGRVIDISSKPLVTRPLRCLSSSEARARRCPCARPIPPKMFARQPR